MSDDDEVEIPHFSCSASVEVAMPVRGPDGKTERKKVRLYPVGSLAVFRLGHLAGALSGVVDAIQSGAKPDVRKAAIAELAEALLSRPQAVALLVLDAMHPQEEKRAHTASETDAFLRATPGVALMVLLFGVVRVNLEGLAPFAEGLPAGAAEAIAEAGEQVLSAAGSST